MNVITKIDVQARKVEEVGWIARAKLLRSLRQCHGIRKVIACIGSQTCEQHIRTGQAGSIVMAFR